MQKVNSYTRTVRELLANKYTLDYYQREYNWQKGQVEEFLDDLTNKFLENYKESHNLEAVDNYSYYFLGPIIISENGKTSERYIVDGQQRLTTLTLLLINLYRMFDDAEDKPDIVNLIFSEEFGQRSFNLDIPERAQCIEALYEGMDFDDTNQPESIRNIIACSDYIKSNFSEDLRGSVLPYFVHWLLEKVYLIEITASVDDDAYTVFETMNDRGLPLSPTDMLKGYLLTKITNVQRDRASKVWRDRIQCLQNLGKDETENAIKAWLRSQHAKRMIDFDLIGNKFHRWVRNQTNELNLKSNDDFANFIERDFKFYSSWYCLLQEVSKSLELGFECVYYNAQHNFTLQYPVLLAPLSITDPKEEIIRKIQIVARYLDILIHRYIWNFRSIDQRSMVRPMFTLMRSIRGRNSDELTELLYEKLTGDNVTFAHNNWYGLQSSSRPKVRLILARITDYMEIQSGQDSRYHEYVRYDVEHIWANHPELHEEEFSHKYEFNEYRNRIGGLLLLPPKRNKVLSNLSYEEKLEEYLKENLLAKSLHERTYGRNRRFREFIQSSRLLFRPCPDFKRADLDDRQKLYQQLAKRIWNPERLRVPHGEEPKIAVDFDNDLQHQKLKKEGNPNKTWTIDQVRDLVPQEYREYYETKHKSKVGALYTRVAELLNLVEKKEWKLTPRFQKSYYALYVENKPIFGVNFFGVPRFAVWITKEEATHLNNYCEFENYHEQYHHAVYPIYTSVDDLLPIFESAYQSVSEIAELQAALAAARKALQQFGVDIGEL